MNDQAMIMQQSLDEDLDALSGSLQQTAARLAASEMKLARMQQTIQEKSAKPRSASLDLQVAALARRMTLASKWSVLRARLRSSNCLTRSIPC
ncbi:MAG TPA: hypothetical protein VN843_21320 [Anaerolineales bacterium]|nr:hypothetical protein [Anaerolineales bacterium]